MTLACPRCTDALVGRRIEDIVVHECPECAGVFFDQNAVALVVQDATDARADAVLAAVPRRALGGTSASSYASCPACRTLMNRKLFAVGDGLVVDVCRDHGVFLDAGELPVLVDFVRGGHLARAASRKTADRIPLHKQPDTFAKTLAMAWLDRPSPPPGAPLTAGGALVQLLLALCT